MKVLNFGSINADHVYKVPHIVTPGETLSGEALQFYAGGKGANQSVAMAKAGANVWHAGKVGGDGVWLKEELEAFGVDVTLVKSYDGPTGHAIIQVTPEGENSIVLFGGGNKFITNQEVDTALKLFNKGDFLVLQNEINNIPYIIEQAAKKGMRIFLNPAPFSSDILNWPLDLVDTLVVNETEAVGLAGEEMSFSKTVDWLTKKYQQVNVVMTVGKVGAYFGSGATRDFVAGRAVEAVDTTAAGDTFLGYYLASLLEGASPKESMERANLAASITVSRPGAMESIPFAKELP